MGSLFPNVIEKLAQGIPPLLTPPTGLTIAAGTRTPADMTGMVFLRFTSPAVPADRVTQRALVHVDAFAPTYRDGYDVSRAVMTLLLDRRRIGSLVLDYVECPSGPTEAEWDNSKIRRFLSIYRVLTRR